MEDSRAVPLRGMRRISPENYAKQEMTTMQKIGFIGLGIMGAPMAKNLRQAGFTLVVYDVLPENVARLAGSGVTAAQNAADVAAQCDIVITMLPNSPHVKTAVLGENGLLSGAKKGLVYIDMSSIAPGAAQEVERACAQKGMRMLDAPVSGGEPKAIDGTLAIMVGGDKALFEEVREPVLLKMGASATWCGAVGAGNTTKLANQVIVACNIAACAEAFTLAKQAGVDPALVLDAIRGGLAGSTVMNAKVPMMLADNDKPGFKIDLHIKDLNNALETGHETGAPLPLTAAVMEMMQTLRAGGCGQDDHSALAKYYAKLSGTSLAE